MPAAIEFGYGLQRLGAGGYKICRQRERGSAALKISSGMFPVCQDRAQIHLEDARHVRRGVQQTGDHALGNLHSHARMRNKEGFGGALLRRGARRRALDPRGRLTRGMPQNILDGYFSVRAGSQNVCRLQLVLSEEPSYGGA